MQRFLLLGIASLIMVGLSLPAIGDTRNNDSGIIAVIVHTNQQTKKINKPALSLIFWRKNLYWSSGQPIRPVNFSAENEIRSQFSSRILNSLPEAQADYWNGLYYHGISPPYVVHSTEAMLRYVAETEGAIGYVSACDVDARVKVLVWVDTSGNLTSETPRCS